MTAFRLALAATAGLCMADAASAQDWSYRATFYAWLPAMTTSLESDFGTVKAEKGTSDVLDSLDMAFMGTFAAQNGRLGFVLDMLYADLSSSQDTPFGDLFGEARVKEKLGAVSGYALYRVTDNPAFDLDLGAGFRAFNLDVGLTLTPDRASRVKKSSSDSWVDPLLAARFSAPLDDRWFVNGLVDFGGTGSTQSSQAFLGLGYAFDENWSTQLGYRYMDIQGRVEGQDVTIDLSGALIAVSYNF